ncbi:hypothetical protein L873DRAFT_1791719 [Choiromyces venosus 120613-1]|uniref:Uncharacterized protein n=1 Tax=Choiromyces venosus 120613-1 TaxID=1336337 RepID=A0A3N4JD80_9PEZI|nr:hypothetical protein L873DRAFT_1796317 [Choiromyces venosus 120613-1]RPA96229.1 hypothetical protein L873DRAFT_1791719 [Choiromyces venosus 120613-1]
MLISPLFPFLNILPRKTVFYSIRRALLSTLNAPTVYANFFKKYNFEKYTFEPGRSPEQEFQLLAKTRQWGTKQTTRNQRLLEIAIRQAEFFERFEDFREDGWDEGKIADVKNQYEVLTGVSSHKEDEAREAYEDVVEGKTAIAKFFIENQCPGYSYSYRSSVVELSELVEAREDMWEEIAGDRERRGSYKKTEEYYRLQREFQVATEECFESFLRVKIGSLEEKETRPWETLAELLKLGKAPMDRSTAAELIKTVHINIYDFIDLFTFHLPPSANTLEKLLTTEFYRVQKLRFPDVVTLAAYSRLIHRVYNLENAKTNGTLVLLLHRLKEHFRSIDDLMKMIHHRNPWDGTPSPDMAKKTLRQIFPREWERLDKELRERFPREWRKDNGG